MKKEFVVFHVKLTTNQLFFSPDKGMKLNLMEINITVAVINSDKGKDL